MFPVAVLKASIVVPCVSISRPAITARKSPRGRRQQPCHGSRRFLVNSSASATSMYLEEGVVHFYQTDNGQLVFLNGFNMTCLLSDFAKNLPTTEEEASGEGDRDRVEEVKLPPLPDILEGMVMEMKTMHLTMH